MIWRKTIIEEIVTPLRRFFSPKDSWNVGVNFDYAMRKLGYTNIEDIVNDDLAWASYTYKYILAEFVSRETGVPYYLVYSVTWRFSPELSENYRWLYNIVTANPDVIFIVALAKKQILRRFEIPPELRR
jgi:hypothetical protein